MKLTVLLLCFSFTFAQKKPIGETIATLIGKNGPQPEPTSPPAVLPSSRPVATPTNTPSDSQDGPSGLVIVAGVVGIILLLLGASAYSTYKVRNELRQDRDSLLEFKPPAPLPGSGAAKFFATQERVKDTDSTTNSLSPKPEAYVPYPKKSSRKEYYPTPLNENMFYQNNPAMNGMAGFNYYQPPPFANAPPNQYFINTPGTAYSPYAVPLVSPQFTRAPAVQPLLATPAFAAPIPRPLTPNSNPKGKRSRPNTPPLPPKPPVAEMDNKPTDPFLAKPLAKPIAVPPSAISRPNTPPPRPSTPTQVLKNRPGTPPFSPKSRPSTPPMSNRHGSNLSKQIPTTAVNSIKERLSDRSIDREKERAIEPVATKLETKEPESDVESEYSEPAESVVKPIAAKLVSSKGKDVVKPEEPRTDDTESKPEPKASNKLDNILLQLKQSYENLDEHPSNYVNDLIDLSENVSEVKRDVEINIDLADLNPVAIDSPVLSTSQRDSMMSVSSVSPIESSVSAYSSHGSQEPLKPVQTERPVSFIDAKRTSVLSAVPSQRQSVLSINRSRVSMLSTKSSIVQANDQKRSSVASSVPETPRESVISMKFNRDSRLSNRQSIQSTNSSLVQTDDQKRTLVVSSVPETPRQSVMSMKFNRDSMLSTASSVLQAEEAKRASVISSESQPSVILDPTILQHAFPVESVRRNSVMSNLSKSDSEISELSKRDTILIQPAQRVSIASRVSSVQEQEEEEGIAHFMVDIPEDRVANNPTADNRASLQSQSESADSFISEFYESEAEDEHVNQIKKEKSKLTNSIYDLDSYR